MAIIYKTNKLKYFYHIMMHFYKKIKYLFTDSGVYLQK